MSADVVSQTIGALPTLDATAPVLGAPAGVVKSKTNVRLFTILGLVLAGLLLVMAGLLVYQKRTSYAPKPAASKTAAPGAPDFMVGNKAVRNASIEADKAAIKAHEAAASAQVQAIADAQAESVRQAQAEAAKSQPYRGGQPASANVQTSAQYAEAPVSPASHATTPTERKLGGMVLFDVGGGSQQVQSRMATLGAQPTSGGSGAGGVMSAGFTPQGSGQGAGGNDSLSSRLQPTVLQARSASRLPNLDYMLLKGTSIPCALKTGIDTTLPGFVVCSVISDVYSANTKTKLVERGATVFGEQQSSLKQGQERTFVVWGRIDTNGVTLNIDSPATDQMGSSGIPGFVDTHFWTRFGGSIMLSLIRDFSAAAAQRTTGGTGMPAQPSYSNTQNAANDMAAEALRNTINVPPTLVVLPGTVVNVMVARDVSFEDVFSIVK